MIAVAAAPSPVATATTGAANRATDQLAMMNTTPPMHQITMLVTVR
ncbi:hypothetical protein PICSAR35_04545 [Mycobacterium avium subsp. paratuberculosis]|nr:hypothetical protein PICSAR35_04545 [Mycobacterium avium subsp. paratuberculosis]